MTKTLQQRLFEKPPGPLPGKFRPKVQIRVTCPRTKQTYEFAEGIAVDGTCPEAFDEAVEKLRAVFCKIGILPAVTTVENANGTEKETGTGSSQGQQEQSQAG